VHAQCWPLPDGAGYFNHLAGDKGVAWSGGSEPGNEINPSAVAAMAEVGIDITREFPKPWTDEIVQAADVVVTMGCGDACPFFPGKRYENWELPDPAGQAVDAVRPIRHDIEGRVRPPPRRTRHHPRRLMSESDPTPSVLFVCVKERRQVSDGRWADEQDRRRHRAGVLG